VESADYGLSLSSIPYSRERQFGVQDVHALLELLQDGSRLPLLPSLLSVFASRACRSAVMVGDALDAPAMRRILRNMADMEQPWACPHGRPTMRHLFDLQLLQPEQQPQPQPPAAATAADA